MHRFLNILALMLLVIYAGTVHMAKATMSTRRTTASTTSPKACNLWSNTGKMHFARYYHSASNLSDGSVLVAGGILYSIEENNLLNSAEVYNPSTGLWVNTGNMTIATAYQTQTTLLSGEVLVAGGYGSYEGKGYYLNTTELYNPSTGLWKNTGSMSVARIYHTATRLNNGKVLVAGGYTYNGSDYYILNSAELYDLSIGHWINTGSTTAARTYATATLLQNGKVLVAGGISNDGYLKTTELYDPSTGLWKRTGDMNVARRGHTATLLVNGKVLVAGGSGSNGDNFTIFNSAEVYDPLTGIWEKTGNMNFGREVHTASLLKNGQVLVAGGEYFYENSFGISNSAELYNPVTGLWAKTCNMTVPRYYHTATSLLNGKVLVAGGANSMGIINSNELYA